MSDSVVLKPENATEAAQEENNPYAYLERDFSSENYKIEVKNLPKYYGFSEFKKFLNAKLNLGSNKIKTPRRNSPYAFVCFRNDSDRDKAIEILNGLKWKGRVLTVHKAKAAPDPLVKKRKVDGENEQQNKKTKTDDRSQEERLKSSAIPLWNLPYDEQLNLKQENVRKVLRKLAHEIAHINPNFKDWIEQQKTANDGAACQLHEIRHAQQTEGYRNKCEFTIGMNEENNLPTVGFRIGSYVNGITGVGPIDNLPHIPEAMKKAAKIFENFVRSSDLQVFNPEYHTGHFRQVMMRSAKDQLMLVVGIHPQDLSEEKLAGFKKDLVEFFDEGPGKEAEVTSLYYQTIIKKKSANDKVQLEHLLGDTHISESLLGLKFRISPEAFFQINKDAAEVLYSSAIELAEVNKSTTVVDVCCGTGTIGLCFAKHCAQILGLEIVPEAIVDAKENAKLNNIENSDFFAGKAEDILSSVFHRATTDDVIAIVDPPRAGLHNKAICHVRKMPKLQRLIYISCNPVAALKNFVDLARPISKTMYGEPLLPTKAVAVDLFPYTEHCELIICFERADKVVKNDDK